MVADISQKTFQEIEQKNITPQKRWVFAIKDFLLWLLFVILIGVGALAFSTILFILTDQDWDVYKYLDKSLFSYVFFSLPYLWLAIFGVFLLAAYLNFRRTTIGYRHEVYLVFVLSFGTSAILGSGLFFTGLDSEIHDILARNIPFYSSCVCSRETVWNNPQKGLLGGVIIEIENQNEFILQDFKGEFWEIGAGEAEWLDALDYREGKEIRIVGIVQGENIFKAQSIRKWHTK